MDPLWILLIGMVVVLGALVVAAFTPAEAVVKHGLRKNLSPEAAQKVADQPVIERVTREFGARADASAC